MDSASFENCTLSIGGFGTAVLATTWAGYPRHGSAAYAPAVLAPQPSGELRHIPYEVYQVMHLPGSVAMEG